MSFFLVTLCSWREVEMDFVMGWIVSPPKITVLKPLVSTAECDGESLQVGPLKREFCEDEAFRMDPNTIWLVSL